MNNSSPRVAIVGCGGIARAHLGAISAANVVALCDSDLESARALQGEMAPHAPIHTDFDQALRSSHADATIICTPPTTHADLVKRALWRGVAVLCEKPLATRAIDAQMLTELAATRQIKLRTSAKYRFAAGVEFAKNWPALGELKRIQIAFGAPFDYARSWHSGLALSGGGVWMDNGPHALDLARYFAGELEVSDVSRWQCDGELETEVRVELRGENGAQVEIELSWLRALGDWFAILTGEGGVLKIGWRQTQWQTRGGVAQIVAGGYDKSACFAAQWRGFIEGDARLGADDGARAVALLEAVYEKR